VSRDNHLSREADGPVWNSIRALTSPAALPVGFGFGLLGRLESVAGRCRLLIIWAKQ